MIAAIHASWVTILVFFSFLCGLVLGSALTYRVVQADRDYRWHR